MAFNWKEFFSLRRSKESQIAGARRGFSFSVAGVSVYEDSAMQVSAYHRGVIYLATQMAKLPWEVKDKKNNVLENRVSYLLNYRPNPEMTAFRFRLWAIACAINNGNAYAEIERDVLGQPLAIWPLGRNEMEPIRDENGKLWYRFSGTAQGNITYLEPKDVLHLANFYTKDGIVGQGLVAYAERTLGISLAADRMASNLFKNSGLPSGYLKHKGKLSEEAYKRLKDSWKEQYGVSGGSGGTALLEEDTSFETIDIDPTALQFLESRKFGVLEIARFLNIHPTKLFDITAATYSNVENANLEMVTDVLDSWARNLEAEADAKLLNDGYGGKFTEIDLYAVFRGDMKTRAEYHTKMMGMGAITPNQIRAREGWAPYEGGDRYYIATNNFTPADRVDEVVDAQIKKGEPPKPTAPEKTPEKTKGELELEEAARDFLRK